MSLCYCKKIVGYDWNVWQKIFGSPILQRSRIKKLQRFLSLSQWDVKQIWFPIFQAWLQQEFEPGDILYLVIDRTQWANVNLLVISLVYNRRAIPIYFTLLGKLLTGFYPESVHVDRIYRTRENRACVRKEEFASVALPWEDHRKS